MFQVRKG